MKKIVVILIALMSMNIQMHAGKEKIGGNIRDWHLSQSFILFSPSLI